MTIVKVRESVSKSYDNEYDLQLQEVRYVYDNGEFEDGFRFIWSKAKKLLAHRGQARIPSIDDMLELIDRAMVSGLIRKSTVQKYAQKWSKA